jgi:hypothetical protein
MSMDNYQQASALIDDTNKRLTNQALPLDLTINFGICQAHLQNIVIAEVGRLVCLSVCLWLVVSRVTVSDLTTPMTHIYTHCSDNSRN